MNKLLVALAAWMPEGVAPRLAAEFPECDFLDAREPAALERGLSQAVILYGLPSGEQLEQASALRWLQLISAGVPPALCPIARPRGLTITNLAGLYGTSIAQHALGMMLMLARNLHVVLRNQQKRRWDREVARAMTNLHGRTLAVVGLGNIGREIARLGRALGMRVIGCRRTDRPTPGVDRVFPCTELRAMLAEADYVVVAAPLTAATEGLLGAAEFAAMKRGGIYVNVSRGGIAQERALLDALASGQVVAAGLDVYAMEPLAPDHPFWDLPQVIVSPHYSGETINNSALPAERFARNLHAWLSGRALEGVVNLDQGY
jgi:phosphoglycerate dehydrogenase-like enzyme